MSASQRLEATQRAGLEGGSGQAAHSWEAYYAPELTWYRHLRNVLHHLPMFRAIRGLRPARVLEVGAGTGSHSIFLSYFLRQVVSVDLSRRLIERCRLHDQRLRGRASFAAMDGCSLAFPGASFDVAFSQGFFEHFSDDEIGWLLREQSRVARYVVLSVPNRSYEVQDFGDERLLSRDEWEKLLDRLGYRLLESRDYSAARARFWRRSRDMYLAVLEPRS
ncbi:MAG: class I SAM-dependent methyltransferase [Dehalococcoidia bacterium]|nr:class I SAM-dependent methyltransferase [Dehalococcoidia bacterium]